VGVVERGQVIDGTAIAPGDLVLGLASTGLHSNGYSLARKVVFEIAGLKATDCVDELGRTVGEALLEPTRIYAKQVRSVLAYYKVKAVVHGIAHITGGGLCENLERIVPEGARVVIDRGAWPAPPIFGWLQRLGEIEQAEMDRVFNMGIGMVLVVSEYYAESIRHQLADLGAESWLIGRVEEGQRGVVWGR
jgi:phosphoribosylformylglycinamidine cyclo-ligase